MGYIDNEKTVSVLFTFSSGQGNAKVEERLDFPTTKEKLRQMIDRVDADGTAECQMSPMFYEYESYSPLGGLTGLTLNEDNVNELNYLAAKLSELDGDDIAKFEAVVESGRHIGDVNGELADYINIAENLNSFTFHPDMDELRYGEELLTGSDNLVDKMIVFLRNSGRYSEEWADYVECMREYTDAEQFGQSMANNNDGEFLTCGYLIEDGGFGEVYHGVNDIPDEYRIWEPTGSFIKAADIELSMLLLEMHALGGNYTQDAGNNFQTLTSGGSDFFITESGGKLTVLPAAEVFRKYSPYNKELQMDYEPEARAFFAAVKETDFSGRWGSIHEVDINLLRDEVALLSYEATYIDAEFKDGTNRLFTPDEWFALSNGLRAQASGMIYRCDPVDEQIVNDFLNGLRESGEKNDRSVTSEEFLANLNAPFMAKAENQQSGMLRIAREAANVMLARGDAEIYRLLPEGALKLSPIDAVKSGGLWYQKHREFAIKSDGTAGLMKWAARTGEEIERQTKRGEHKKSHDNASIEF